MRSAKLIAEDYLFIAVVITVALVTRLHLLFASQFIIDADEAIVGLMAKHITEGKGIPVFYYGQHYMGSLEPICVSLLFFLFGISAVALKTVPLVFSLALLIVVYLFCIKAGGRGVARLSTIFLALPPMGLLEWSSKARGGFIEILFLGAFALWYCTRLDGLLWMDRLGKRYIGLIGFILGLGWWTNNQIVYFFLPVGLLCLRWGFTQRAPIDLIKAFLLATVSFFIGSAPYWIYNITHHFISFEMFQSAKAEDIGRHFSGLFESALPILLGAKRFWHEEEVFSHSTLLAYGVYGVFCLLFLLPKVRHRIKGDVFFWTLFPIAFALGTVIFARSAYGHLVLAPRYLLPLYVFLFPFVSVMIVHGLKEHRLLQWFATAGILALNLCSVYLGGLAIPGEPLVYNGERVSKDHHDLVAWLSEKNITLVRTNYWIGYRLAFETGEKVRFLMFHEPYQIRMPEYEDAIKNEGDELSLPIIAVPSQAPVIEKGLQLLNFPYQRTKQSGYEIFYDIKPFHHRDDGQNLVKIPSTSYEVATNYHPEVIQLLSDNNLDTRWGSGTAQKPGMEIQITFNEPREVRRLKLDLGKFQTDYPRMLEIDSEDENGVRSVVLDSAELASILTFVHESSAVDLWLPAGTYKKLILRQIGTDPVFDWSIAELEIFST